MRAIVLRGPGQVSLEDVPAPEPGPGEALIDVRCAGICGTDLQLVRGYMAFTGIPGHEFVGTVTRVTSRPDRVLNGCRVAGEINLACGECRRCAEGLSRHCGRRRVMGLLGKDGVFAQQVTLPVRNLHVIPDGVTDEQAVFIEPAAAALEILDQISVSPSQDILVLGDGRLGLLAAQALASRGCEVTVAGRHETKLSLARSLGLKTIMAHDMGDDTKDRDRHDMVVEATGSAQGLDLALGLVRPRGTVVMKTTCEGATPFAAWRAVVNEITMVGSRCGRFEPALALLQSRSINVADMISESLPLADARRAFRRAAAPGVLKVLLQGD